MRAGASENGFYHISDDDGHDYAVYCDFNSEPGSAWTLIMSWALKNNHIPAIKAWLLSSAPVNGNSPNWEAYRYDILQRPCFHVRCFPFKQFSRTVSKMLA